MVELTVGYVAGIIAFTVAVVQLWTPNTLVFILAGILRDKNTAATWGVAGRAIQSSLWPEFLRTDTSLTRSVRWDVRVIVKSIHLMRVFVAIAGIITPLGLYSVISTADTVFPTFQYVKDASPFGLATPNRSNLTLSRKCYSGGFGLSACPYSKDIVIETSYGNGTINWNMPYNMSTKVPETLREIYSSGTNGFPTTISNYFDIEWRQYSTAKDKFYDNGTEFLIGAYRQMDSLILNDNIQPVEGLLVDTKSGGIGFRNHTIPLDVGQGAIWEEDILFIQPETVCVDTNLTIEFSVPSYGNFTANNIQDIFLVDRGGFAELNRTYPTYDHDNAQDNPDLLRRAYKAAWINNAMTMVYLNVTNPSDQEAGVKAFSYMNSTVGKKFPLPYSSLTLYQALGISSDFGSYLNFGSSFDSTADYPNPFDIRSDNFSDAGLICNGAGRTDRANITNIMVNCGLMRGAPQRLGEGSPFSFDGGSRWSTPIYSCASSVKATIKTTSFLLNGTQGFDSLSVTDVRPKTYRNKDSLPIWGVEDTGKRNSEIQLIWGLISSEYENYPNISSVRKESLQLPGYVSTLSGGFAYIGQNMPASEFYNLALAGSYDLYDSGGSKPKVDYTGYSNMAMYVRWQNLSATAQSASSIVNLIWTDLAAAAVVGTRGTLGSSNAGTQNIQIPVQPFTNQVKYRWLFGIPAFLVAFLCIVIGFLAFCSSVFRRHNFTNMRRHLNQSSTGRIFTAFLYPEYCNLETPSGHWNQTVGKNVIDLGGDNPIMSMLARNNFSKGGMVVHETNVAGEWDGFLVPRTPSPYTGHSQQFPPPPHQHSPQFYQG